MDLYCKKSVIKRFFYSGIFLSMLTVLFVTLPSQTAQADFCGDPNACPLCGDGILCSDEELCEPLEECDDGNTINGDGCSSTCQAEPCKNNVLDDGEQCDVVDGTTVTNGECEADECNTDLCICTVCGNGVIGPGEQCDDGNTEDGDGCSSMCLVEKDCPVCTRCGDGNTDPDEDCDDGDLINTNGCKNDCSFNECGDGIVCLDQATCDPVEECDDADDSNNDTCTNACLFNECGDTFILTGRELCDDGNTIPNDGCSPDCLTCPKIECGDGIPEGFEECDDGNDIENDACHNDCTNNICGDGSRDLSPESEEECDDGNLVSGDGCSSTCQSEVPGSPICGNGVLEQGEQCDNGDDNANNAACKSNCTNNICGDGFVGPDEECDDYNTDNNDGCSSTCDNECGNNVLDDNDNEECDVVDGSVMTDGTCDADRCNTDLCICAICGNGEVGPGETCDDGNTTPGDGCDENCLLEEDDCPTNGVLECDLSHKRLVCHVPPGNPDNAHTICIDKHAVSAHISHHEGDELGACDLECPGGGIALGGGTPTEPSEDTGGCSLIRH